MSATAIGLFGARWLGLRLALRLLARRPWATLASIVSCAIALFLPLLVLTCANAVTPFAASVRLAPEVSVFIAAGTGSTDIKALQARIQTVDGVSQVRLIPRDAALSELRGRAPAGAPLPELTPNPLPDVLVAELQPGAARADVEAVAAALRKLPKVESVQFDSEWYRKLAALLRAGAVIGSLVGIWAVALVFAILIGALRLQADSAAEELRLLDLVGAAPTFIRRPYVYAGAIALLTAGGLAVGMIAATEWVLTGALQDLAQAYGLRFDFPRPTPELLGAFLVGAFGWGALVAWIGTRTTPAFPR